MVCDLTLRSEEKRIPMVTSMLTSTRGDMKPILLWSTFTHLVEIGDMFFNT